jgi:hypothetical protein
MRIKGMGHGSSVLIEMNRNGGCTALRQAHNTERNANMGLRRRGMRQPIGSVTYNDRAPVVGPDRPQHPRSRLAR